MTEDELREEEAKRQLDLGLWRRILRHARPYRWQFAGMALSGLLVAGIDTLLPRVTGLLIDAAVADGYGPAMKRQIANYVGLIVAMAGLVWFFIVLAGRIATGFAYDIRRSAFARLQQLSLSFFDHRPVGWLLARVTSDCEKVSSILPWFLLDVVWGTALILGASVSMLMLNARLALFVIALLPVVIVLSIFFQRRLLQSQRQVRRVNSEITASFNEGILGVRTTKSLVREEANLGEFQQQSREMFRHSVRNATYAAIYLPIVMTLGSIGTGLALWQGGIQAPFGISLGTLVAFLQYAAFFYAPVEEMAERFTALQAAQASAERIQTLLDTEPEIADSDAVRARLAAADAAQEAGQPRAPGIAPDGYPERIGTIRFENISFAYRPEEPVLERFDLEVHAGESIALVGATGSGKTTIVGLLCRFYEPTSGVIRIDGVDYRDRSLAWLQSQVAMVLQAPHLFRGTVRENIRYGRLEATDAEIEEAARMVDAHGWIVALENGYETDVGEGGNLLSTGQKQLIAMARAVLARKQVFVMDEATSSVDTETERSIQKGIEKVLEGRLSFLIAHRLSTIRSCDRILVIDRGRILEQGTHEELMRLHGRYRTLYRNQFARESGERILHIRSEPGVAGGETVTA